MKSTKKKNTLYTDRILSYVGTKKPLGILTSTPSRISRLIQGLTDAQLRLPLTKGKWSIAQIINHLCDGEVVLAYRSRKIIAEPGTRIQAYDQDKWAANLHYDASDAKMQLELFTAVRRGNVVLLRSLKPNEWKRFGIHEERGKESIKRLALLYAGHDINHLRQISSIRSSILQSNRQ